MGKSNLLLERKNLGARANGTILISGFEMMSGWISDSITVSHVIIS
jgi:hypothetical protein